MGIGALALPLSWIYGAVTELRNLLYDTEILTSRTFDVPVISVGNISVGGTGKTPHTEYLIRLLNPDHQVCVLSRGYRRKSKGFQLAQPNSTVDDIGDEPMQIYSKFPDVQVAVDANRCHGIDTLMKIQEANNQNHKTVILLDDAFQHRKVKPGLNILLTDYHHPIFCDSLMPVGRLREYAKNSKRADIIIVTKCPADLSPTEQNAIEQHLQPKNWQRIFYSTFCYSGLPKETDILMVTGIAKPAPLEDELKRLGNNVLTMNFNDHHRYSATDVENIMRKSEGRTIVTTEKDAVKLRQYQSSGLKFITATIEVSILGNRQEEFNNIITNYANTGTW